jgi:DNA repair exonuclease SbcCD ATPase subunit
MSYRRMMFVTLLLLLVTMAGCAAFSAIGDGSPEEMKKAKMSKDDLWNQTKELEKEKADYQKRLADQQEELARMAKDLSDQQTEITQANKQVAELGKSVDELNAQMRQIQEARQREHPLKETELVQPKKETAKPVKKTKSPKREVRKASSEAKEREQKATDTSAILKQITEAKQTLSVGKEEPETPPKKKEADASRDKITEKKQEAQPEAPAVKAREPKPLDDLSLQMKQFAEAEERETAAKETGSPQVKKGMAKEDKAVKAPKQIVRKDPAETQPAQKKALKIKVLAGDGDIASARSLSKRLGKMGYRVKLIDKAPRSDFDTTVVYYGTDHRAAGETMAKRLGGGVATKLLTWSSDFDIIVVTGRQP